MRVTLEQVRAALAPEELDYNEAAKKLGKEALPYLERLVASAEPLLASKAAYLAGVIGTERAARAVGRAARSADPSMRVAAAAAAQHLPDKSASDTLLGLVDDADVSVQRIALRSVPAAPSAALRARLEGLSAARGSSALVRELSRDALSRAAQPEGGTARARAGSKRGAAKKGAAKKGAAKKGGTGIKGGAGKSARGGSKKR